MEKLYCTIFIVDISQNPDEVETISSRIQQLIEDHGGIIKTNNRWGKRRLAYALAGKTHGSYVEIEFNASSRLNIPKILEGEFRLNDRVLRYMTYIIEKEELVQRAKNAGKARSVKEETPQPETPRKEEESSEAAEVAVEETNEISETSEANEISEASETEAQPAEETTEPLTGNEPENEKKEEGE